MSNTKQRLEGKDAVLKDKPVVNMYKDIVLNIDRDLGNHTHVISMLGAHTKTGKLTVVNQWVISTLQIVDTDKMQLNGHGMIVGTVEKGDE